MGSAIDVHNLISGNQSPKIDSGYATAASSASNTPSGSTDSEACASGKRGAPIPFKLTGLGIPKISDRFPSDATELRFKYVMERMELPLHKYLQKSRLRFQPNVPMSIRLAMLEGISAEDVRPGIVILCRENLVKRVRRYFDKPEPKSLCRPEDSKLPHFEVVVIGKAPQLTMARGDIQVFAEIPPQSSPRTTLCGEPIKVANGAHIRVATMGGIIRVRDADGRCMFYGMIAGHVAKQIQIHDLGLNKLGQPCLLSGTKGAQVTTAKNMDKYEEESDYFSSEDEQERDQRAKVGVSQQSDPFWADRIPLINPTPGSRPPVNVPKKWESLGDISIQADCKPHVEYYDWALVPIDEQKISRNILRDVKQTHKLPSGDLNFTIGNLEHTKSRSVLMASGAQGLRQGRISTIPTKFLSAPGQSFVDTYSLRLIDDDEEISEGDSGSWIIDEKTLEVYGHLVASDALGYGYVIPLYKTFENIQQQLGVVSVDLPTAIDIFCTLSAPRTPPLQPQFNAPFFGDSLDRFNDSGYNSFNPSPENAKSYSSPAGHSLKRRKPNHEAEDAASGEASSSWLSEEKKVVEGLKTRKRKAFHSDLDEEKPTEKVVNYKAQQAVSENDWLSD